MRIQSAVSAKYMVAASTALGTVLFFLWKWQSKPTSKRKEKTLPERSMQDQGTSEPLLRERLTVILTTSPIGRHPSTDLLDEVMASFAHAKGLSECDVILVCDGYKSVDDRGDSFKQSKFRSGIVDLTSAANYEQFKDILRKRLVPNATPALTVLELDTRHGFGFAVKAALELVKTPYVIVVQHDRPFIRQVDIPKLLHAMESDPARFKYVGLPTSTTCGHRYHVLSKYGLRIEPVQIDDTGLEFMPLIQWYDSTHLCLTEYYRSFVFGPRKLVVRGGFIEDKLGQAQLAAIRSEGVDKAHPEYGTFIASGPGFNEPCVGHLDGRDALSSAKFRFVTGGPGEVSWAQQAAQAATAAMAARQFEATKSSSSALRQGIALAQPLKNQKQGTVDGQVSVEVQNQAAKSDINPSLSEQSTEDIPSPQGSPMKITSNLEVSPISSASRIVSTQLGAKTLPARVQRRGKAMARPSGSKESLKRAPASVDDAPRKIDFSELASPKTELSCTACPTTGWEYMDAAGTVRGPFTLQEMQHWNSQGYFRSDLLMRCNPKDTFTAFGALFPPPLVPFQGYPRRPVPVPSSYHPR